MTQKIGRETPKLAGKKRLARYGTEPFLLSVSAGLIPGSLCSTPKRGTRKSLCALRPSWRNNV